MTRSFYLNLFIIFYLLNISLLCVVLMRQCVKLKFSDHNHMLLYKMKTETTRHEYSISHLSFRYIFFFCLIFVVFPTFTWLKNDFLFLLIFITVISPAWSENAFNSFTLEWMQQKTISLTTNMSFFHNSVFLYIYYILIF